MVCFRAAQTNAKREKGFEAQLVPFPAFLDSLILYGLTLFMVLKLDGVFSSKNPQSSDRKSPNAKHLLVLTLY